MSEKLTENFVIPERLKDQAVRMAYVAGAVAMIHAIGTRLHNFHRDGLVSKEVDKLNLELVLEMTKQAVQADEHTRDMVENHEKTSVAFKKLVGVPGSELLDSIKGYIHKKPKEEAIIIKHHAERNGPDAKATEEEFTEMVDDVTDILTENEEGFLFYLKRLGTEEERSVKDGIHEVKGRFYFHKFGKAEALLAMVKGFGMDKKEVLRALDSM